MDVPKGFSPGVLVRWRKVGGLLLLPPLFGRIHPRFRTPYLSTILTGTIIATVAGLTPIEVLGQLVSIGTLLAFVLVSVGVIVLRRHAPEMPRPFRAPFVPIVPLAAAAICLMQMAALPLATWERLIAWLTVGLAVYFTYGRRHADAVAACGLRTSARIP